MARPNNARAGLLSAVNMPPPPNRDRAGARSTQHKAGAVSALAERWALISEAKTTRRWPRSGYHLTLLTLSEEEQRKFPTACITDWASLSAQQRNQARPEF